MRGIYFKNNFIDNVFLSPTFFFKKKIFSDFFKFKKLIKNSNYFFFNVYRNSLIPGSNLIIIDKNNELTINEDSKDIIQFKQNYEEKKEFFLNHNKINFFFNFNLFLSQNIEIYKIIILLYLYKICN